MEGAKNVNQMILQCEVPFILPSLGVGTSSCSRVYFTAFKGKEIQDWFHQSVILQLGLHKGHNVSRDAWFKWADLEPKSES